MGIGLATRVLPVRLESLTYSAARNFLMPRILRPVLIVLLALLIPIVPFIGFGEQLEARIREWSESKPPHGVVAAAIVGVLTTDVFLPIPSSFISTFGGAELGVALGTAASWLGMTAGAMLGYVLARIFGQPLAARFARPEELARMETLTRRWGARAIVLSRAVPVLAEASVLLMGATGLSWRQFVWPMALANLGIALAYSILGHLGKTNDAVLIALAASITLPITAAVLARFLLPKPLVNEESAEPQMHAD